MGDLPSGFPGGSEGKASACNAGNPGSIPGSGRSPGEVNGNPLQFSCLENPTDGGAWWAPGVAKSWTRLSDFTFVHPGSQVFIRGNHSFSLYKPTICFSGCMVSITCKNTTY